MTVTFQSCEIALHNPADAADLDTEVPGHRAPGAVPGTLSLGELAARLELPLPDDPTLVATAFSTRCLGRDDVLYRAGDPFESLFIAWSGVFKTVLIDAAGLEQVLAFPGPGDVLGIDGIDSGRHPSEAVALDRSHVVVVPFARIDQLAHQDRAIGRLLHRMLGRELERKHTMMWLLGTLHADARVAAFLLDVASRRAELGLPGDAIDLRMTRGELGSYLGVKLETVSRALSAFAAAGLIRVERRSVTLLDPDGLRQILEREGAASRAAPWLRMIHPVATAPAT